MTDPLPAANSHHHHTPGYSNQIQRRSHQPRVVMGGVDTRLSAFHQTSSSSPCRRSSSSSTSSSNSSDVDLRKRIREIYQDASLDSQTKARKIQRLMTASSGNVNKTDSESGIADPHEKTFHDKALNILGCAHYARKAKIQAACCNEIFPCRICHDEAKDHPIIW
ncbi:hypothetical protein K492DRAFT_184546 [Lichtheimia hyalospora FSU 10163]|nr:hypothetical protein K492DRAFT_184546 [Lichtheimia hyalospora FSU 10163]